MVNTINQYRADLRELDFVLFEQLGLQDVLGQGRFESWRPEDVRLVLKQVYRFASEVSGPLNRIGDVEGCKLIDGRVKTPTGFRDAWQQLSQAGWAVVSAPLEHGGQGSPRTLGYVVSELLAGSNTSFSMYSALTLGAAELIASFGTEEQKQLFCEKLMSGRFAGTMCLTEPQAGSDVGECRSEAERNTDGTYSIRGTKIFISGGDHDLCENVVHMVLARIKGAPSGTKGLSLFIVPRDWVGVDGKIAESNDVATLSIEHKMGIHASATCALNFGERGACRGFLCGGTEHEGLQQMFQMVNAARILVGMQGLASASSAYLNALQYARERRQGSSLADARNPDAPRVALIDHPDVRRMLLDMKARVEGIRALGLKLTVHIDHAEFLSGSDPERANYHQGQVDLLTPIFKAYATDQAFEIAATAIQVYGGSGFLQDHPVEQYCRDSKIFSIYEGTNHIQALDLVGRKLRKGGGRSAMAFLADVAQFIENHAEHPALAGAVTELRKAHEATFTSLMGLMQWGSSGMFDLAALFANRILEMMAELAIGTLLLEGAVIAHARLREIPSQHPERAFYEGKVHAGTYYAFNVVPSVVAKAGVLGAQDRSALDISSASFATV